MPQATLSWSQLRIPQRQPFHALRTEVDLNARIAPPPLGGDNDAEAELGMLDVLADTKAAGFVLLMEPGISLRPPPW